jgi:hypothetical protein
MVIRKRRKVDQRIHASPSSEKHQTYSFHDYDDDGDYSDDLIYYY